MKASESLHLEHTGWLEFPPGDLVAKYVRQGWFEFAERAFCWTFLRRGFTYLDIGAHAGFHAATARKILGNSGRVICVEPNPSLHRYLQANVADVELRDVAITDQSGTSSFDIQDTTSSSFAHLTNGGAPDAITVRTTTLPELLEELGDCRPNLIKIDIEGAEHALFGGARDYLREFAGVILVEFSKDNLERFGETTQSLESLIREIGFELCVFDGHRNRLSTAQPEHPVWYENYFLCRHPQDVNKHLARVSAQRRRVVTDIYIKGEAAKASYDLAVEQDKAHAKLVDICNRYRGLHTFVETDGAKPLQPISAAGQPGDPISELQNLFGASKAIAEHTLAELHRRQRILQQVSRDLARVTGTAVAVEDLLGLSTLRELQSERAETEVFEAAVVDTQNLLESQKIVKARVEGLQEAVTWATELRATHDHLVETLEATISQQAGELRQGLQQKDEALEQLRNTVDELRCKAQQEQHDAQAAFGALEAELDQTKSELQQVRDELKQSQAAETKNLEALTALKAELDQTERELQQVRDELKQSQAAETKNLEALTALETSLAQTQGELQKAQQERQDARAAFGALEAELDQSKSELQQRRGELDAEREKTARQEQLVEDAANENAALNQRISDASEELKQLVTTRDQFQANLRDRDAYYAQLISTAVNDLYELRRSRLIKLGDMINANALRKIDATIKKMST